MKPVITLGVLCAKPPNVGPERRPRVNLRLASVAIALVLAAMLLGTGVYQNVVEGD